MNCEIFFEINGSEQETYAVAAKIVAFLTMLDIKGDIANLDGSFNGKPLTTFLAGTS